MSGRLLCGADLGADFVFDVDDEVDAVGVFVGVVEGDHEAAACGDFGGRGCACESLRVELVPAGFDGAEEHPHSIGGEAEGVLIGRGAGRRRVAGRLGANDWA